MPPPNPPRNLRGQLLNDKGKPIDAVGRRLDSFDRPIEDRISEPTEDLPVAGLPNLTIAYPSLGDWLAMFDPRHNRGDQADIGRPPGLQTPASTADDGHAAEDSQPASRQSAAQ